MDKNNSVQGLLGASMEKIKEMVDANTVIGTPINAADGTILIPVSRISYGFASGGSDLPNKANAELFGGGSGAGINITPIAFLVIANGDVKLLQLVSKPGFRRSASSTWSRIWWTRSPACSRRTRNTTQRKTEGEDDRTSQGAGRILSPVSVHSISHLPCICLVVGRWLILFKQILSAAACAAAVCYSLAAPAKAEGQKPESLSSLSAVFVLSRSRDGCCTRRTPIRPSPWLAPPS